MNILCIDIGTTSMRGILYNELGSIQGIKSILTPLVFQGSYIEQKPEVYLDGLLEICDTLQRYGEIDAISLTSLRSVVTLADAGGEALTNFIMWQDDRNSHIVENLKKYDAEIHQTTGTPVNTVFTAGKITWMKDNLPEIYQKAYKAMIVPDYLIHYMCGTWTTDRSYGSRTNLMNLKTGEWDEKMLEIFNIDKEKLCDLVDTGIVGSTNSTFERETGIRKGTPVISSGGDQQNSALGLGEMDSSSMVINCGTGSFILALADRPYLENPAMMCNVSAMKDKYIIESNVMSSAASLNWLIKEFFPDEWHRGNANYDNINDIAASSPIGANGVICVPLFQGCGSRDWNQNARAGFFNISLGNTRADIARSLYEGIAAEIALSIYSFPEEYQKADKIMIGGGMTKSDFFDQVLADVTGRKLYRYSDSQASAIGAFMNAAVALKIYDSYYEAFAAIRRETIPHCFTPFADHHDFYEGYLEEYERLNKTINH